MPPAPCQGRNMGLEGRSGLARHGKDPRMEFPPSWSCPWGGAEEGPGEAQAACWGFCLPDPTPAPRSPTPSARAGQQLPQLLLVKPHECQGLEGKQRDGISVFRPWQASEGSDWNPPGTTGGRGGRGCSFRQGGSDPRQPKAGQLTPPSGLTKEDFLEEEEPTQGQGKGICSFNWQRWVKRHPAMCTQA